MCRHKHRQILTLIKHLLLPAGKRERCYCYDFVNYLGGVRHCGEEQQYNQNLDRHPGIDSQREHWITADTTGTLNSHVCYLELHFQALLYHKCTSTGETTQTIYYNLLDFLETLGRFFSPNNTAPQGTESSEQLAWCAQSLGRTKECIRMVNFWIGLLYK